MKDRVSVFALLVLSTLACKELPAVELPLPERAIPALEPIVQSAAHQSPRMVSRALELEMAEETRIQARAGMLPTVGGYASINQTRDDRADQANALDVTKTAYNFSLTQPLYFWGERRNYARIGEIQKHMSARNYLEAYRGLVQEIRQRYLGLIIQKQGVRRAAAGFERSQVELRLAEERFVARTISDSQIAAARFAVEHAQLHLDRTEFDFQAGLRSFAVLSGIADFSAARVPDDVPSPVHTQGAVDRLVAGYLSATELPSYESANFRDLQSIEALNLANVKTRLKPKFSLVIGASQDEQSYDLNVAQKYQVNSYYGGLSLSWTIFDGFAAQSALRTSLARKRMMDGDAKQLRDRLMEQAQTMAKQLEFAARGVRISDRAYEGAQISVKARQEDFARGLASEADVAGAELALMDSRTAAFAARADYFARAGELLGLVAQDPVISNLTSR